MIQPVAVVGLWAVLCSCATRTVPAPTDGPGLSPGDPPGCVSDDQCPNGFCDTTQKCGTASYQFGYGIECTVPPLELPAETRAKLSNCGPYRCQDGRCRSCKSDQQCLGPGEVNDPTRPIACSPPDFVEGRPGRRCGAY